MTAHRIVFAFALAILPAPAGAASLAPVDAANCVGCHAKSGRDPELPRLVGRKSSDVVGRSAPARGRRR
jgi:cytochrome c553